MGGPSTSVPLPACVLFATAVHPCGAFPLFPPLHIRLGSLLSCVFPESWYWEGSHSRSSSFPVLTVPRVPVAFCFCAAFTLLPVSQVVTRLFLTFLSTTIPECLSLVDSPAIPTHPPIAVRAFFCVSRTNPPPTVTRGDLCVPPAFVRCLVVLAPDLGCEPR